MYDFYGLETQIHYQFQILYNAPIHENEGKALNG